VNREHRAVSSDRAVDPRSAGRPPLRPLVAPPGPRCGDRARSDPGPPGIGLRGTRGIARGAQASSGGRPRSGSSTAVREVRRPSISSTPRSASDASAPRSGIGCVWSAGGGSVVTRGRTSPVVPHRRRVVASHRDGHATGADPVAAIRRKGLSHASSRDDSLGSRAATFARHPSTAGSRPATVTPAAGVVRRTLDVQ